MFKTDSLSFSSPWSTWSFIYLGINSSFFCDSISLTNQGYKGSLDIVHQTVCDLYIPCLGNHRKKTPVMWISYRLTENILMRYELITFSLVPPGSFLVNWVTTFLVFTRSSYINLHFSLFFIFFEQVFRFHFHKMRPTLFIANQVGFTSIGSITIFLFTGSFLSKKEKESPV